MKFMFGSKSLISVSMALAVFLVSCGSGNNQENSDVKVTNGIAVSESSYPSVVQILRLVGEDQYNGCTATFVNSYQVVTAAHCTEGQNSQDPKIYYVTYQSGQPVLVAKATRFKKNTNYSGGVSASDLAVVSFPADTAPATTAITDVAPKVGDVFTIVGYGQNRTFKTPQGDSGSGSGTKRVGTNTVAALSGGFIRFAGVPGSSSNLEAGELVASGPGDSGGPLLINGKLAGVTSGGGLADTSTGTVKTSNYVNLKSEESVKFLKTVLNK